MQTETREGIRPPESDATSRQAGIVTVLVSAWVWVASAILIVVWVPLVAIVRLLDRDPALYRTGRMFRALGAVMTRVNPFWSVEVTGEIVTDPRNPYVVVSNHQSLADIPVISRLPWEMKWVGKKSLFKLPFAGLMMRMARDICIDRSDPLSRANVLRASADFLSKKCSVMLFPEGTRSRDGRVGRYKDGAFRLAIQAQVPILPLAIDGSRDALPRSSWLLSRDISIRLRVLDPVPTAGLDESDARDLAERVRQMVISTIAGWRGVEPWTVDALDGQGTTES